MPLPVMHDRAESDPRGSLLNELLHRTVAIVGFGNQGAAHALNMRDSGVQVLIGARSGSRSGAEATRQGFEVLPVEEASARAALVVLGLPDHLQARLCREQIMPAMEAGATLGFMHGFSLRFGGLEPRPDLGVVLVAPKGPGAALRQRYLEGRGIPCLLAVHQENAGREAERLGLAWASAIGCGRAGIVRTSVGDEAETDLFGEQAVLCGGTVALAHAAFETLVSAGYPPELAYVECVHELKQVVDLIFERGIEGMYSRVSGTAEFGGRRAETRLADSALRSRLRELLEEIRSGRFALEMEVDEARGFEWLEGRRREGRTDAIETAGRQVRQWIPWLATEDAGASDAAATAAAQQASTEAQGAS
jgi:ketol-acid reductoisomerase